MRVKVSCKRNPAPAEWYRVLGIYRMMCIAGAGVARETRATCALSEESSMLFAERIALDDVENKRVSH